MGRYWEVLDVSLHGEASVKLAQEKKGHWWAGLRYATEQDEHGQAGRLECPRDGLKAQHQCLKLEAKQQARPLGR